MTVLRHRAFELGIGDRIWKGLRCSFKVSRTLKEDPNCAEISVYNLTDSQRAAISDSKVPLVRLAAGYAAGTPESSKGGAELTQIFYGQVIHVEHEVKDAEIITHLTTGDGIEAYRKARINISFGKSTKTAEVLRTLVKAFDLKPGNVEHIARQLNASLKAQMYIAATAVSGSAATELSALCRSAGLEWSIQDGQMQILERNKTFDQFAIRLAPDSGLVGSPSVSNKGIVTGVALLVKDMIPGRQIEIDARFVKGRYRLEKVEYVGDTHGDDWYANFEGKTLKAV